MPANTSPVFTLTPNIGGGAATAANTDSTGAGTIGTNIFVVYTAGANGAWLSRIRFQAAASVAATATTATVARVFISSIGTGTTTTANTWLIGEVTLSAVTADSASAATNFVELQLNMAIPAAYTVLVTNHAAPAANTRWVTTLPGSGDF